ncbi:unnamed protein product [Lampetra planeri]
MAYAQMAAIFEPPSSARQKFLLRKRGEAETPLAFCSSLLVLGRAAYPNMDGAALDSLALERLLSLARELGVVLAIGKEADISSLKVAQGDPSIPLPAPVAWCGSVCRGPGSSEGWHAAGRESSCHLRCTRPTLERRQGPPAGAAMAGEDFSLAGVGVHHLLPLWPAWPHCDGLLQRSSGLRWDLVSLCLHIGIVIWASGKSWRISHSAAPPISHI